MSTRAETRDSANNQKHGFIHGYCNFYEKIFFF